MDEFFGLIFGIAIFVLSVVWLYGVFILFVNKNISNRGFYWFWTVRHNPRTWLQTCIITNFIVGWMIIFSVIILIPNSESTFGSLFKFYILLLIFITNILSYTGIKSLFQRIIKSSDKEQLDTD